MYEKIIFTAVVVNSLDFQLQPQKKTMTSFEQAPCYTCGLAVQK